MEEIGGVLELKITCPFCGNQTVLVLHDEEVDAYENWKAGMLIQDAFPDWPEEKRELLITGICDYCWEKTFG